MNNDKIIELRNVTMRHNDNIVLRDINLSINRGDFWAITGPNGGGKTTLLRIILHLLKPSEGSVTYFSNGIPSKDIRFGYLPQKNMIDSRFPITVNEVISLGLNNRKKILSDKQLQLITDTIKLVGLESHTNAGLGQLSGGQLQRTLLARAIISKPEVLVLDEPLSYIDKQFEHRIYDIIQNLASTTTILLVSHEMSTIASMANKHIIVDREIEFCNSHNHFIHYDCCSHHHK